MGAAGGSGRRELHKGSSRRELQSWSSRKEVIGFLSSYAKSIGMEFKVIHPTRFLRKLHFIAE